MLKKSKLTLIFFYALTGIFALFYLINVFFPPKYDNHDTFLGVGVLGLLAFVFLRGGKEVSIVQRVSTIILSALVTMQVIVLLTGSYNIIFSHFIVDLLFHVSFSGAFLLFAIGILQRTQAYKKNQILRKASFDFNEAVLFEFDQTKKMMRFEFSQRMMNKHKYECIKGHVTLDEFKTWINEEDLALISNEDKQSVQSRLINMIIHIKFFNTLPPISIQIKGSYQYENTIIYLGYDYSDFEKLTLAKEKEKTHRVDLIDYMQLGFVEHEMIFDENGQAVNYRYIYVNDIFTALTGTKKEDIVGRLVTEVFPNTSLERIRRYQALFEGTQSLDFESYFSKTESTYHLRAYRSDNNRFITLFHNISDLKSANKKLQYLVTHNNNGLLNYRGLTDALKQLTPCKEAYCFHFTIDNSDDIKTFYGHNFMNEILDKIAIEISCYKDEYIVAHTSFNHFVIILKDAPSEVVVRVFAHANRMIYRSYSVLGHELNIKMNVGYAMIKNSDEYFELIKHAEIANINADIQVHNEVVKYNSVFAHDLETNAKTAQYLYDAIRNDEMDIYFQKIVDSTTNQVMFVEALARWTNKDLGYVPPDKFFLLALQADMIDFLDDYLIAKTLKAYQYYVNKLVTKPKLSINLSSTALLRINYDVFLINEVTKNELKPEDIILEISEETFIQDTNIIIDRIKRFQSYGFKIAIDDFGSKYSSLGILDLVPFDILKLDGLFAERINSKTIVEIVKTITQLACLYNKQIVIEKIETSEVANIFNGFGCTVHQGYFYQKPEPFYQ